METRTPTVNSVADQVAGNVRWLADLWWDTPTTLPDLGLCPSEVERQAREDELSALLAYLLDEVQRPPAPGAQRATWERDVEQRVARYVVALLGLGAPHLDVLLNAGLDVVVAEFPRRARVFDPLIGGADIFQAARNAAVINSLQIVLGRDVRLTPALFAYSMLYPYTDNYLDDPQVPPEAKRTYTERFGLRLAGQEVGPRNSHERRLFDLVSLVEGQYPREHYPQVYEALQAIHQAQNRSLALHGGIRAPLAHDVLGISLEKGGASVLADAYLVQGTLDDTVAAFAMGWGALLQFVDDLQDVAADRADGVLTVFSQSAGRWPLDPLVNRLLHLCRRVLDGAGCLDTPRLRPLRDLMSASAAAMVQDAVGRHPRFVTADYYRTLESHAPLRFSALRRGRRRLLRQQDVLSGLVEKYASGE
ncbi:MAG: hypothetical protein ACYC4R_09305 [Anaerolineae bacterium]